MFGLHMLFNFVKSKRKGIAPALVLMFMQKRQATIMVLESITDGLKIIQKLPMASLV